MYRSRFHTPVGASPWGGFKGLRPCADPRGLVEGASAAWDSAGGRGHGWVGPTDGGMDRRTAGQTDRTGTDGMGRHGTDGKGWDGTRRDGTGREGLRVGGRLARRKGGVGRTDRCLHGCAPLALHLFFAGCSVGGARESPLPSPFSFARGGHSPAGPVEHPHRMLTRWLLREIPAGHYRYVY